MGEYSSEELKKKDSELIIRPWWVKPIIITEGKGVYVKDIDGKEYIDTASAFFVLNLGYSHPEVVKAIKDQAEKVIQTTMYQSSIPMIELTEKLVKITPRNLTRVFYTAGGAEAVEVATKMARLYTGKSEIIALKAAYHGTSTIASATLTGIAKTKVGTNPQIPGVYHAAPPYCYRCYYGLTYPECGLTCAYDIERVLKTDSVGDAAAVLVEPILGAGGAIIPPDPWLREVRKICDEHGLLLIADEVQTGFARSGEMFAIEHSGVEPDIMCLSKAVGGGLPQGAVVAREEIAEKFKTVIPPTFAGNTLACVSGLKTIEVIEKERVWENAAKMGAYFKKKFTEISEWHPSIGDVRFKGLMGGVELVVDRRTREPAVDEAKEVTPKLMDLGVIAFPGGISGSVFRIQPPLNISKREADKVVDAFDEVLPK
ncbi:MAG: aspartate aminotransferase family protein [Candidatus Bathyarchaeia archaeon]